MSWKEDIEAGREKLRKEQEKKRIKIRTRGQQFQRRHNGFLVWIGENIERIAPRARQVVSMVQPFLEYVKGDLKALGLKLHIIREKKYDHLSAAWRRGRGL